MGNHILEHRQSCVNTTPLITSKATIVETQKQYVKVGVTQSLGANITTTWVETIVVPNINVVRRGVLIRFVAKLGSRSNGIFGNKEFELKFDTTSNYYWSCWHISNGVY